LVWLRLTPTTARAVASIPTVLLTDPGTRQEVTSLRGLLDGRVNRA
jgi:hypothetical protein